MAVFSDIYQFIFEQGTPSTLPGPWAGLECAAALFDLPLKPSELVKRLRKKFSVEDLRRAGVVTVGGQRTVRLSPQLAENPSYIVALRRAAGEKPYDLVAGSCSLRNRTLSSLLKDYQIKEMLESTATVGRRHHAGGSRCPDLKGDPGLRRPAGSTSMTCMVHA